MKALALVKYKTHSKPDTGGSTRNDIVTIVPTTIIVGSKDLDAFVPFIIDITIPCGEMFNYINNIKQYNCIRCKNNNPKLCDVQKYQQGIWGGADLLTKPKLIKKCAYTIEINDHISVGTSMDLVENTEKTELEKIEVFSRCDKYPLTSTAIKVKT
jgi:hypothetical protein